MTESGLWSVDLQLENWMKEKPIDYTLLTKGFGIDPVNNIGW